MAKRVLTTSEKTEFTTAAEKIFEKMCGENWKDRFMTQKKFNLFSDDGKESWKKENPTKLHLIAHPFELPVLGKIVLQDMQCRHCPDITMEGLSHDLLTKINDKDPNDLYTLLSTFMSHQEMQKRWKIHREKQLDAVTNNVEKFETLLSAA